MGVAKAAYGMANADLPLLWMPYENVIVFEKFVEHVEWSAQRGRTSMWLIGLPLSIIAVPAGLALIAATVLAVCGLPLALISTFSSWSERTQSRREADISRVSDGT